MGTAPQNYQTPKTNWQAGNVPTAGDFNRIEGNIQAIEENLRTIDPAQAPTGNQGSLRQLLDWFANRIKAITGKTNWYDAPSKTLEDLNTHINSAAPHSGHETPSGAQAKVDTHAAVKASSTILGHVKQGSGVTIDSDGIISANVLSVAGKTGNVTLTKADVGLSNVDNMSALDIRSDSTKKLVVEVNSVAPANPVAGQIWFDSANKKFRGFNGAAWL